MNRADTQRTYNFIVEDWRWNLYGKAMFMGRIVVKYPIYKLFSTVFDFFCTCAVLFVSAHCSIFVFLFSKKMFLNLFWIRLHELAWTRSKCILSHGRQFLLQVHSSRDRLSHRLLKLARWLQHQQFLLQFQMSSLLFRLKILNKNPF